MCCYVPRIRICKQIEVAAKIGPMIKRLDDRNVISFAFERGADVMQKCQGFGDTRLLSREGGLRPFDTGIIRCLAYHLQKHLKAAYNHVV